MLKHKIRAVFFDIGGTLDDRTTDIDRASYAVWKFLRKKNIKTDFQQLRTDLAQGFKAYQKWSMRTKSEPSSEYLWRHIMLKRMGIFARGNQFPFSKLSDIFETAYYGKKLRKNVRITLAILRRKKLRLGCISNTILSQQQFVKILKGYHIDSYFDVITLSSKIGKKKPHPKIFQHALKRCGVSAKQAAFVGDTLSRDISGAKKAGFAVAIQIKSSLSAQKDVNYSGVKPDFVISKIEEVIPILLSPTVIET
jgi:putative hydrolase of the HAD superfamily